MARPDLNGELGVTLNFNDTAGRWLVRLANGEGKQVKPSNLQPLLLRRDNGAGGKGGKGGGKEERVAMAVQVFWGDARWSRAQLLGEIARGHWGESLSYLVTELLSY